MREFALCLMLAGIVFAQRAVERNGSVFYETTDKREVNLGRGFSPVLTRSGKVVFLHGANLGYGTEYDCAQPDKKNWVAIFDPVTGKESILFDRPIDYDDRGRMFCIYDALAVSADMKTLYLVAPVYATAGSLAVVGLQSGRISFVPGVNEVHIIDGGAHAGELIYTRRLYHKLADGPPGEYPYYPWVHARADGTQIRVIGEEHGELTKGDRAAPKLAAYLRNLGGSIQVNGHRFPNRVDARANGHRN